MTLMDRGPLGQKQPRPKPNRAHIAKVKALPCVICGAPPPSDAHHCRDLPDYDEQGLYEWLPGAASKSGDRDTIPLCQPCHWDFHNRRGAFHAVNGKDYGYIAPTRAAVSDAEIDF